jgi:hypothetical protein
MSIFDEMERDAVAFQKAPTAEESQTLTQMGLELVEIDRRLEKYAEVAKALMERKLQLQMKDMVSAMEAVNQDVIGLGDQNCDLVLSDYFKAGLPNPDTAKDDEERARMAVLRQQGIDFLTVDAPDILTTELIVTLPKGSLELAVLMRQTLVALFGAEATPDSRLVFLTEEIEDGRSSLLGLLAERNEPGFESGRAGITEGVHWGTLTSYVKEQVRDRKRSDLPLEALGATVGRIVKIVKRKAKK